LYIQNGDLSLDEPMPYKIKDDDGKVVAIIDNTGEISTINKDYPDLSMLITKDKLYFRQPKSLDFSIKDEDSSKIYSQDMNQLGNEVFDAKEFVHENKIFYLRLIVLVLIYPAIFSFFCTIYTIAMFVLSMLGQTVALTLFRFTLKYKESCRLLSVAITPQILVIFTFMASGVTFNGSGVFFLILFFSYFCYALASIKIERSMLVKA
jgi:hypothetical protein